MEPNQKRNQDEGNVDGERSHDGLRIPQVDPTTPMDLAARLADHMATQDAAASEAFEEFGDPNALGLDDLVDADTDADDASLELPSSTPDLPVQPSGNGGLAIDDAVLRPDESITVERGPYISTQDVGHSSIELLSKSNDDSESETTGASDFSSSQQGDSAPTAAVAGGPSLTIPVVVVSLSADQQRRIHDEALAAAARRDAQTVAEIAEEKVNYAFWVRDSEERAIWGDP